MKRDLELCRKILIEVENTNHSQGIRDLKIESYDATLIKYHIHLLNQAGLIDAVIQRDSANEIYATDVFELTWDGHEFLDSIKNERVWNKVIEFVKKKGGDMSFSVLKELAVKFSSEYFLH